MDFACYVGVVTPLEFRRDLESVLLAVRRKGRLLESLWIGGARRHTHPISLAAMADWLTGFIHHSHPGLGVLKGGSFSPSVPNIRNAGVDHLKIVLLLALSCGAEVLGDTV